MNEEVNINFYNDFVEFYKFYITVILNNGSEVKTANGNVIISTTNVVSDISIEFSGTSLAVYCGDENTDWTKVKFYFDKQVSAVSLNGTSVNFTQNGTMITIEK